MNCIIHPDEIFLKGNNQPFFYRALLNNLRALFPGVLAERVEGGVWLRNLPDAEFERLLLVPGIAKAAPALACASDWGEIKNAVATLPFAGISAVTFRVTTERSYKKFPLTSRELDTKLGELVAKKTGWKVNLKNYDVNIEAAVGKDQAFISWGARAGAGGLPTGTSGKVLCLLSGGIDSPVAAYAMMRRGAEVGLIHFQNQTRVTEEVSQKIFDLARVLVRYQPGIWLFIVPFGGWQKQIVMKVPADYRMLVTRRLFFRIAQNITRKHNYLALATGDSLGQVASQTLENMTAIYAGTPALKLAPLVGTNKKEIMDIARRIGTLEISNRPYEDCCSLYVSRHPATRARTGDVDKLLSEFDEGAIDETEVISYNIGTN